MTTMDEYLETLSIGELDALPTLAYKKYSEKQSILMTKELTDKLQNLEGFESCSVEYKYTGERGDEKATTKITFDLRPVSQKVFGISLNGLPVKKNTIDIKSICEFNDVDRTGEQDHLYVVTSFGEAKRTHKEDAESEFESIQFGNWTANDSVELLQMVLVLTMPNSIDYFEDYDVINYNDWPEQDETEISKRASLIKVDKEEMEIFKKIVPFVKKYGFRDVEVEYKLDGGKEECSFTFYHSDETKDFKTTTYYDRNTYMFPEYTSIELSPFTYEDETSIIKICMPLYGEHMLKT